MWTLSFRFNKSDIVNPRSEAFYFQVGNTVVELIKDNCFDVLDVELFQKKIWKTHLITRHTNINAHISGSKSAVKLCILNKNLIKKTSDSKRMYLYDMKQLMILCLMTELYLTKLADVQQFGSHCRIVVIFKLSYEIYTSVKSKIYSM